jgi:hypothetical protein
MDAPTRGRAFIDTTTGFWILLVVPQLMVIAAWWFLPQFVAQGLVAGSGQINFGQAFVIVNVLFTGMSFVGLISVLLLQRRELQLQRLELVNFVAAFQLHGAEFAKSSAFHAEISKAQLETARLMERQAESQGVSARMRVLATAHEVQIAKERSLFELEQEAGRKAQEADRLAREQQGEAAALAKAKDVSSEHQRWKLLHEHAALELEKIRGAILEAAREQGHKSPP